MLTKRETNHLGHFLLTLFIWPWLFAWIMFYMSNRSHNDEVDRMIWQASQKD